MLNRSHSVHTKNGNTFAVNTAEELRNGLRDTHLCLFDVWRPAPSNVALWSGKFVIVDVDQAEQL